MQVKAAAREAGERAKVAVSSTKRDVDPIGACVGLRGTRIQVISRELRGEKIDIVEWSPDSAAFVARALSPAKVSSVTVSELVEGSPRTSCALGARDRPRQPALARDRQEGAERAAGREADRHPGRHQERGRGRGGAAPRRGRARGGPAEASATCPASARSWWTAWWTRGCTRRPGWWRAGCRPCRSCRASARPRRARSWPRPRRGWPSIRSRPIGSAEPEPEAPAVEDGGSEIEPTHLRS